MGTNEGGSGSRWLWGIVGLAMMGAMGFLSVFLLQQCGAGADVVEAFVDQVKGGEDVSPAVGGAEAETLTAILRSSTAVAVGNFQAQADTACFWTSVAHASGETEVRFLLRDGDDGTEVVALSARRDCECPDPDFEQECRLVGPP